MATTETTEADLNGDSPSGLGLRETLARTERLFAETGSYDGLVGDLELKGSDPILFEKLFSRLRGGLVSARETALNISASPIVKELGELCFAVYTPSGDSVALSTGIIVHVHTMSDVIKYMIREGFEDDPGINAGDVFCNNDSMIGDVHNADVQTIVPIFHEGELAGWVAGVTHVIEIGASTPGSLPLGPISRFEDGIDIPCRKIGADDELFRDHVLGAARGTRMPNYWALDERTRLAGCLLARNQVQSLIEDVGLDTYRRFCGEVIEDGRRAFRSRLFTMTVPGRYRAPAFAELTMGDEPAMPSQARVDTLMHAPVEVTVKVDARLELDLDGASSWGYHSANCTPSAMQGGVWVLLTQTLLANDKINDGAYYAIGTNFPPGSWSNHQNPQASTGSPWRFLVPCFTGVLKSLSMSMQSRGFVEEVLSPYAMSANTFQGGGIDHRGMQSSVTNFAISCVGGGARMFGDGLDYAAAMWNPQGDMGDCEVWEISEPFLFLGASVKPSTAGAGRFRGGSGWEALRLCWGTDFFAVQNMGNGAMTMQSGLWGGYPGATGYRHNVRDTNFFELVGGRLPYPVSDGDPEDSGLMAVSGRRDFDQRTLTMPEPMAEGDLYLSPMRGGAGLGDPLEREPEAVVADVTGKYLNERFADSVYGVKVDRDGALDEAATQRRRDQILRERERGSQPVSEWMRTERERISASAGGFEGEFIEPVRRMYAESMRLSPKWAEQFRGFWDLPADFRFDIETPTVDISERLLAGRDPDELQRQPRTDATYELPDLGASNEPTSAETIEALIDGTLPGRQTREVQAGYKDGERFRTYLEVLSARWPFREDRILLPFGLHLCIVELPDGRRVVRSDSGHVFGHYRDNWKLNAQIRVRRTREQMLEIYPDKMHPDPEWNELREYFDPVSFRLLDVESVPPGYPVVHDFLPDLEAFYADWLGEPLPPERAG
ncbi:MAG: hydantoinase B/oxoprolinase family protein [Solirubrobacterales bacterium]|nr:hydantoinase B/oxoprolinase family protein [Solirubrobacterales bacterium]